MLQKATEDKTKLVNEALAERLWSCAADISGSSVNSLTQLAEIVSNFQNRNTSEEDQIPTAVLHVMLQSFIKDAQTTIHHAGDDFHFLLDRFLGEPVNNIIASINNNDRILRTKKRRLEKRRTKAIERLGVNPNYAREFRQLLGFVIFESDKTITFAAAVFGLSRTYLSVALKGDKTFFMPTINKIVAHLEEDHLKPKPDFLAYDKYRRRMADARLRAEGVAWRLPQKEDIFLEFGAAFHELLNAVIKNSKRNNTFAAAKLANTTQSVMSEWVRGIKPIYRETAEIIVAVLDSDLTATPRLFEGYDSEIGPMMKVAILTLMSKDEVGLQRNRRIHANMAKKRLAATASGTNL